MTSAYRQRLMAQVPALAQSVAEKEQRRRGAPRDQLEELIQAAAEAGVKAALRYDKSKGVPFEIFAKIRMRGAVVDEIRRIMGARTVDGELRRTRPQTVSRDATPGLDHEDPKNPIADFINKAETDQQRRVFWAAMGRLSEDDRKVITQRFIEGRPVTDMAHDWAITPSGMTHKIGATIGRLRDAMWDVQQRIPGESATPPIPPGALRHARNRTTPGLRHIPTQRSPR